MCENSHLGDMCKFLQTLFINMAQLSALFLKEAGNLISATLNPFDSEEKTWVFRPLLFFLLV